MPPKLRYWESNDFKNTCTIWQYVLRLPALGKINGLNTRKNKLSRMRKTKRKQGKIGTNLSRELNY